METPKICHLRPRQLSAPTAKERASWNSTKFLELMRSMRDDGMREPIRVKKLQPGSFEIIDGKKRWLAAYGLGWKDLICLDFTDIHST